MDLPFGLLKTGGSQTIQQTRSYTHHLMRNGNGEYETLLIGLSMTGIVVSLLPTFTKKIWKLFCRFH